jgi:hypothetical protein
LFEKRENVPLHDQRIGIGFDSKIVDDLFYRPPLLKPVPNETSGRIQSCDLIARDIENGGAVLVDHGTKTGRYQRRFGASNNLDIPNQGVLFSIGWARG